RADVGQRAHGSRGIGAGVTKGKRVSEVVGRRAAARTRGERGRTARPTGPWPWQHTVRAEENRGGRAPRCAGYVIAGRFLATGAANASTRIQRGVSVLRALGSSACARKSMGPPRPTNQLSGGRPRGHQLEPETTSARLLHKGKPRCREPF